MRGPPRPVTNAREWAARAGIIPWYAAGADAPFSPLDIDGLRLWLDAADASTITHTGGAVTKWVSKDANAREFTQATGSLQPTTGSTTQNGLNTLHFNADRLFFDGAKSVWKFLHDGTKCSVYAVWKAANVASPNGRYVLLLTGGVSSEVGMYIAFDDRNTASRNDVTQVLVQNKEANRALINTSGDNAFPSNEYNLQSIHLDVSNGVAEDRSIMTVNAGAQIKNNTQTGTPSTDDPTYVMSIGGGFNVGDDPLTGQIAEILVYERDMSAQEVENVEGYLAEKWGLTLA